MRGRTAALFALQALLRGDEARARHWLAGLTRGERDMVAAACRVLAAVAEEDR